MKPQRMRVWAEWLPAMECWVWCYGRTDGTELGTRTCWADAIDAACLIVLKEELKRSVWTLPSPHLAA